MCSESPKKWRFTWEAQSHTPILKLFLFDSRTNPSIHCTNLQVQLNIPQSHLLVTWIAQDQTNNTDKVSLRVPIPRVLIDPESPVNFRALNDHIEVKLLLLLPVDHPIISSFDSVLNLTDDCESNRVFDSLKPLIMDSDLKSLASTEGVHFYCRSCSTRLTISPLRHFVEMPSANWQELADNWFGGCCCSFGGASEKLVNRYAGAYTCAKGVCLLNSTAVTLCKDDLVGYKFVDRDGISSCKLKQCFSGDNGLSEKAMLDATANCGRVANCDGQSEALPDANGKLSSSHHNFENVAKSIEYKVTEEKSNDNGLFCGLPSSNLSENVAPTSGWCDSMCHAHDFIDEVSAPDASKHFLVDLKAAEGVELMENQKSFLNGFLGDVFMARSYNLSSSIEWKQFVCPRCSSLLGAYPCANGDAPVDDGVRFFKCYVSTYLPVGGSSDFFRKYTLEKMFSNQLVESAKDELSFRTVVLDLTTKSPMLQVVLLNPNSWCSSGYCFDSDSNMKSASKLDLQPVIKVLFSDCSQNAESQLRVLEDWVSKNLADEVFMLKRLIEELVETMASMKDVFPPSCTFLQGLSLSFMPR